MSVVTFWKLDLHKETGVDEYFAAPAIHCCTHEALPVMCVDQMVYKKSINFLVQLSGDTKGYSGHNGPEPGVFQMLFDKDFAITAQACRELSEVGIKAVSAYDNPEARQRTDILAVMQTSAN